MANPTAGPNAIAMLWEVAKLVIASPRLLGGAISRIIVRVAEPVAPEPTLRKIVGISNMSGEMTTIMISAPMTLRARPTTTIPLRLHRSTPNP